MSLTSGLDVTVEQRLGRGKCLVSTVRLAAGHDIVEEVAAVVWPIFDAPANEKVGAFCEACMATDPKDAEDGAWLECDVCAGRLCCAACLSGALHALLCTCVPRLRAWQQSTEQQAHCQLSAAEAAASRPRRSKLGAEAIARCNARIATHAVRLQKAHGLSSGDALHNACRLFELACPLPEGYDIELVGTTVSALCAVLRRECAAPLRAHLEPFGCAEAASLCELLLSDAHVAGLLQRLMVNPLSWRMPGTEGLSFCGLFLLTMCANHSCEPSVRVLPARSGDELAPNGTLTLRLSHDVPPNTELTISYVDDSLPLAQRRALLEHWGFRCECARCMHEEAQATEEPDMTSSATPRPQTRRTLRPRRVAAGTPYMKM